MNHYTFPFIESINDVLPHINGREEFKVVYKDDYIVVNYIVQFESTFEWNSGDPTGSAIRRECRGITFDRNGRIICRKLHKFFNCNERKETQLNKINLYEPHVIQIKLDGSMICAQPSNQGFTLVTKSGITDISMNAHGFILDKPNYRKFINYCISKNSTPIFEWVSRKNRIVIDYPKDNLILTAIRSNNSGFYVPYSVLQSLCQDFKLPIVDEINILPTQNIELLTKQVKEWTGQEGIVLRFDSGHMVKCKSEDYVLRHKTKEQINQEKNVIGVILEDLVDDMIPLLLEADANRLKKFQKDFWDGVNTVEHKLTEMYKSGCHYENQKDFAVEFVNKLEVQYRPFMFSMRTGRNPKELLLEAIGKNLSTQTRVDNARWMWNRAKWNI